MESSQNSVLVDPLSDFSLVSFFPRTFNQLGFDPDPNVRQNDPLEAVGAHLESMALKNPNRLLEQAKRILDGGLESLNVNSLVNGRCEDTIGNLRGEQRDLENLKTASHEDTVGDLLGGKHENVQARRPALGRKRSRFSLKPNSSQSTEILKPFVDIDKLPDPEEFFSALEKHENAKNELRRQTGKPLMDLDQNVPHMAEKRRRPGLLRKSASYKHRFSMGPSSDGKTLLSSQETLSQDLCSQSPSSHCLQTDNTGQESAGKERPGTVNDEIQSSPDKDDESDELIGILQKRFKPVEINKSCLLELNSALQSEFRTVGESLREDKMSDLHAIVSNIAKETTLGYNDVERRSGPHPSTSPIPPKSPHSSISLLKARLFHARQGKDPFSDLDMDLSPAKDVQKSLKDKDARETNLNSILQMELDDENVEHGESDVNQRSPLHNKESDTTHNLETTEDISKTLGVHSDVEMHTELDHCIQRNQSPKSAAPQTGSYVVHDNNMHDFDADNLGPSEKTMIDHSMDSGIALNMTPDAELDHDIMAHSTLGGVLEDNPSEVSDDAAISVDEHMEPDDGNLQVVEEDIEGCNMEKSNCNMEQSTANAVEDLGEHVHPSGTNDDLDHGRPLTSLARPLKKAKKASSSKKTEHNRSKTRETAEKKAPTARKHTRERLEFSPRKSLADNYSMTPGAELDHDIMAHNTVGGILEDDPSKVSDDAVISVDELVELDAGVLEEDVEGQNVEKANCNMEQSTANAVEDHGEYGAKDDFDHDRPSTSRARPLKKTKKTYSSKRTEHNRSKTKEAAEKRAPAARKHTRECMNFSRRKSLAACGTQWEAGIRKSTRIRTRPLEYWKGERQLYGRIHEALVTVVGTKYFSPTKEAGQLAAMKVKSYVSDEYKEIVELAALH